MQEMTNGNPYPQRFQAHIRRQKKIQSLKDTFLRVVEYIKYKFLHPRKSLRSFYWDTIPPLRDFYKSIRLFLNRSIATIRDTKTFFIKRIRTDSIRSFSKNHLKVMNEDWNDKKSLREKSIIEAFNYAYSKAQDREYIP